MISSNGLLEMASFTPSSLQAPDAWCGHLPFAAWLIRILEPKIFIELGTHTGNSYFSFCQSVSEAGLATKCYAVDTWQGDEHAGNYGNEVFNQVNTHNQAHYSTFSRLLRMTFDDARNYFADGSIELLHIDGLHTYGAVKHDFETWLSKLAPGAVVLFHDTNVRERSFGVWKLWEELQNRYPNNLEFLHSHGLGVIQLDGATNAKKLAWLDANSVEQRQLKDYFSALGARQLERFELGQTKIQVSNLTQAVAEREVKIGEYHEAVLERDRRIDWQAGEIAESRAINSELQESKLQLQKSRDAKIGEYHVAAVQREELIRQLYRSHSWQVTRPFRWITRGISSGINVLARLSPRKISYVYKLAKPHLLEIFSMPGALATKFHFLFIGIRSGGYKAVVKRLQLSEEMRRTTANHPVSKNQWRLDEFMQQLGIVGTQKVVQGRTDIEVAVIVPVYRGAGETKRCIESVLNSSVVTPYQLIIINDCTPEMEVDELLSTYEGRFSHVNVLKNKQNLGFVQTVNRGMKLAGKADVVLLNSDAEVASDWLDRLVGQAYAEDSIGTVTPFSNNATICNYPNLDGWTTLPEGETVGSIDMACKLANANMAVDIPTAVGFCMYIKQTCLQDVGLFDAEAFGKGYGEENDFCLRASSKGWRHILATDTFVFHEGEVSFSESAYEKKQNAMRILRKRYPHYEDEITAHIIQNAAYPRMIAVTAARYCTGKQPVILFITHNYGGGTEKHVQELAALLNKHDVRVIILRPFIGEDGSDVSLEAYEGRDKLHVGLSSQNLSVLAEVLKRFGITKAHIHHTIGFRFSVEALLVQIDVPYDITIHDFYSICPRINLMQPGKGYCGCPTADECNSCLDTDPKPGANIEITWWRAKFASLLGAATSVFCPSQDTAARVSAFFPAANTQVVPHEHIPVPNPKPVSVLRSKKRIAILGVLAEHKGLSLVESLAREIEVRALPMEMVLIGYSERPIAGRHALMQTGPYADENILRLIEEYDPDAILFPVQWPETYSYTMSSAILSGRMIVAAEIGALPERVANLPNAYTYPFAYKGAELADYLQGLFQKIASADNGFA